MINCWASDVFSNNKAVQAMRCWKRLCMLNLKSSLIKVDFGTQFSLQLKVRYVLSHEPFHWKDSMKVLFYCSAFPNVKSKVNGIYRASWKLKSADLRIFLHF